MFSKIMAKRKLFIAKIFKRNSAKNDPNRDPRWLPEGAKWWEPEGGWETYVHSGVSEAWGIDESGGLDQVLSEENKQVARACSRISDRIEAGEIDREEGLREIGRLLLRDGGIYTVEEFAKMDDAYKSNLTLVAGHDIRKSLPRNNDSIDKKGET